MKRFLDPGTWAVVIATFLLFAIALITKGLTHDLLLEAGVLLVSVKLIMMAYKTSLFYKDISEDTKRILKILSDKPEA